MTEQLEHAIQHIKTRADAWAVKEVTEALRSISERLDKALSQEPTDDKCHYCEHTYTPYKGNTGEFEQEPCDDEDDGWIDDEYGRSIRLEQNKTETIPPLEPCDDAVSREAVEQMIKAEMPERGAWEIGGNIGDIEKQTVCEVCVDLLQGLNELPSVTQKSGKWLLKRTFPTKLYDEYLNEYQCSECYRGIRCTESQLVNYPYCHCGAKMESEDKE